MIKAAGYNEFLQVANRYGRGIGNDYLLPGYVEKLIRAGYLYYYAGKNALFIYEMRDGYMKLSVRLTDESAELIQPDVSLSVLTGKKGLLNESSFRPCPVAQITKENCRTEQLFSRFPLAAFTVNKGLPGKADRWLLARGFTLRQERVRYTAAALNVKPSTEPIEVVDAAAAYPIYRECFDMLIADLPMPELFEGALCLRDEVGKAVGVLSLGADRHIGVLPEYRGKGAAMRLYAMLAAYQPQLGTQRLFADVDNPASNGLYRKLGFNADRVILRCYTK
jgi:ribosomal protein S18 acetylase RimI-like enzyme